MYRWALAMIQIAILVVLVIIALVLAPWLIGVAVALAVAYGVYVVVIGAIGIVALLVVVFWETMTRPKTDDAPTITTGARINCKHCQAEMPDNLLFCDNCHNKL